MRGCCRVVLTVIVTVFLVVLITFGCLMLFDRSGRTLHEDATYKTPSPLHLRNRFNCYEGASLPRPGGRPKARNISHFYSCDRPFPGFTPRPPRRRQKMEDKYGEESESEEEDSVEAGTLTIDKLGRFSKKDQEKVHGAFFKKHELENQRKANPTFSSLKRPNKKGSDKKQSSSKSPEFIDLTQSPQLPASDVIPPFLLDEKDDVGGDASKQTEQPIIQSPLVSGDESSKTYLKQASDRIPTVKLSHKARRRLDFDRVSGQAKEESNPSQEPIIAATISEKEDKDKLNGAPPQTQDVAGKNILNTKMVNKTKLRRKKRKRVGIKIRETFTRAKALNE